MAKLKTLSEAETARRRAVTGLRNLGRDDEADRYDAMDAREYADAKRIELVENPNRRRSRMPRKSIDDYKQQVQDLNDQIADLQDENDALNDKLDTIADALNGDDSDDNGDTDSDDSDADDDQD